MKQPSLTSKSNLGRAVKKGVLWTLTGRGVVMLADIVSTILLLARKFLGYRRCGRSGNRYYWYCSQLCSRSLASETRFGGTALQGIHFRFSVNSSESRQLSCGLRS